MSLPGDNQVQIHRRARPRARLSGELLSLMTALSFVYARLTRKVVRLNCEIGQAAETNMGLFRIFRPITVDARQSTKAETIATDLGFTNVNPGDWVIRGEGGESYILNNDFFQRTFRPVEERQLSRESQSNPASSKTVIDLPAQMTQHRLRVVARRSQRVKQSI